MNISQLFISQYITKSKKGFQNMGPIKKKHKLMRGTDEDVDVVDKSHGAGFWQPSQPSGVISGLAHFFPLHLLLIILMQYPSTYHPVASVVLLIVGRCSVSCLTKNSITECFMDWMQLLSYVQEKLGHQGTNKSTVTT